MRVLRCLRSVAPIAMLLIAACLNGSLDRMQRLKAALHYTTGKICTVTGTCARVHASHAAIGRASSDAVGGRLGSDAQHKIKGSGARSSSWRR